MRAQVYWFSNLAGTLVQMVYFTLITLWRCEGWLRPGKFILYVFFVCRFVFFEMFSFTKSLNPLNLWFPSENIFPQTNKHTTRTPPQEDSYLACAYQTTHQKQTHAIRRPFKISNRRGEPPPSDSKIHLKPIFVPLNSPSNWQQFVSPKCIFRTEGFLRG